MEALQNNTTREVTPYQPTTDWGAGQNLSFRCMQTALALLIDRVREIIEYGQVTTVPMMPGYVRGVLNLRGNVVPVIDLRRKHGAAAAASDSTDKPPCILTTLEGAHTGIIVDQVLSILDIPPDRFELVKDASRLPISHVVAFEDRLISVLILDRLLPSV